MPSTSTRRWRGVRLALVLLAVVCALAAGGLYARTVLASRASATRYLTEPAAPRTIEGKVTASGTLSALRTVQVGSQVSGTIESLGADFNSRVHKGDVVANIEPALFSAAVRQASANLAAARAAATKARAAASDAKIKLDRAGALSAQGIVAQADVDTARTNALEAAADIETASAQIAQREAELSTAEINLSHTKIISPVDGVVIARNVDVGQTVAASLQAPVLFTIAEDLSKMQIDTNIAEGDIGRLEVGLKVSFGVDAFTGETFHGTIREIRNSALTLQNVVTYDAVIDVANPDLRLRPGMTANVTIVYRDVDAKIAVPNEALRFQPEEAGSAISGATPLPPNERVVYVLKGQAVQRTLVKPGLTDGAATEIVEGDLADGDLVITDAVGPPGARKPATGSSPLQPAGRRSF